MSLLFNKPLASVSAYPRVERFVVCQTLGLARSVGVAHETAIGRQLAIEVVASVGRQVILLGQHGGVGPEVSAQVDRPTIAGVICDAAEGIIDEAVDAVPEHDFTEISTVD